MNSYSFNQRCRARTDFRIPEIVRFLQLMKIAFRFPVLYDRNSKAVDVTEESLAATFRRRFTAKTSPIFGATDVFFSIPPKNRDDNTVRFEIHTGTRSDQIFIDTYAISIGKAEKMPDLLYFEESIKIFKPFEAFISEFKNETLVDAYDRQQEIPKFDKPAVIRGFHYLDELMAQSVGGIEYCLKAPVWRVERFCEGVLIKLTPGLFDNYNPEHLEVQQAAMRYFHMV